MESMWVQELAGCRLTDEGHFVLGNKNSNQQDAKDRANLISSIKLCGKQRHLVQGSRVHTEIIIRQTCPDIVISTSLVDMYGKCGALAEAQDVFDELQIRNVVSWNALINAYGYNGIAHEALRCFANMQQEGLHPDAVTFTCVLKVVGVENLIKLGEEIHARIRNDALLDTNVILRTSLLDMYAKCGKLASAEEVFDEVLEKDVAAWTALISGYLQHGLCHEALNCFQKMQDNGVYPDGITFACVFRACGALPSVKMGYEMHAMAINEGMLSLNITLTNTLLDMYAKCGAISEAEITFHRLPFRDVISWNTLIAGYLQHGYDHEALHCYKTMQEDGISPDEATFASILKACKKIQSLKTGMEIHAQIKKQGFLERSVIIRTALVDMYAKCGSVIEAQAVFDELPAQNVISWNALISGYAQNGLDDEALVSFEKMQNNGLLPDAATFACILGVCGRNRSLIMGENIHNELRKLGLLKTNILLGIVLVDMYAKCGSLLKAQHVFDELPMHSVVSWNALITGYVQNGQGEEALGCFQKMRDEGLLPNAITFTCALNACSIAKSIKKGEEIHEEVRKQGLLEENTVLCTALVDMYVKCGEIAKAENAFNECSQQDVALWTSLIAGYVLNGSPDEALKCFDRMQSEGFIPDAITFCFVLNACGMVGSIIRCEKIHDTVKRLGLLDNNVVLGTALMDMYINCGALSKAQDVFNGLLVKDIVSWNTIIHGYAQDGLGHEALSCFEQMQSNGVRPNVVTCASALKACGTVGSLEIGRQMHAEVKKHGFFAADTIVGISLIEFYTKCGAILEAQNVFDELPVHNVVSWNVLIIGYAHLGQADMVFMLFQKMIAKDIIPDAITFVALLTACAHTGLVEEGETYLSVMSSIYCLIPTLEHCACITDLFSRAGHLERALNEIKEYDCSELWSTLLGGCVKGMNVELGRLAFDHLVQDNQSYGPAYVCMSNLYASASIQQD